MREREIIARGHKLNEKKKTKQNETNKKMPTTANTEARFIYKYRASHRIRETNKQYQKNQVEQAYNK